jgi:hypothetical protein
LDLWRFKASPACDRTGTPIALTSGQELEQTPGASPMERTFMLPNGIQAGVTTTEPPSRSHPVRFGKDVPVRFYVSNAEALKRVICRFGELTKEEREGIC